MVRGYFVTGTDTEVGKTFMTQAMMQIALQLRKTVVGYKPVAAGCVVTEHGLRNEDAVCLQQSSSFRIPYDQINPYAFEEPAAPHLAAERVKEKICLKTIADGYERLRRKEPDLLFVEGAGGWRLPLGDGQFMSDFVISHELPVILVVGVRLGCLNHACLTMESIQKDGLKIAGWIANHRDNSMPFLTENIQTLKSLIDAPFLGEVPMVLSPKEARHYLDISPLLHY
ncbi:MAG: dethiobiotin synthase [Aestuariibacter sp.]